MASVKRRANGSWRARYRDLNGREHAQHFSTRRDADNWLDSVRGDMSRGIHVDPRAGKITYEKWSAQYFAGASAQATDNAGSRQDRQREALRSGDRQTRRSRV